PPRSSLFPYTTLFRSKYIDGQGRTLGGVLAGSAKLMSDMVGFLRTAGPTLSPFNAWLFLKGLETLRIRMQAHSTSALEIAQWLEQQPGIRKVYYAGLPSHPQHELARRQQSAFGAVVSFEVEGDRAAAWRFMDATRMISITTNLGDTKSTIAHPASTSHGRLTPAERAAAGIGDSLIRLAVGLEAVGALKAVLARGLAAVKGWFRLSMKKPRFGGAFLVPAGVSRAGRWCCCPRGLRTAAAECLAGWPVGCRRRRCARR